MDSGVIKLCGVAIIAAISALMLKKGKSEISFAPCIAVLLIIFGFCLRALEPLLDEVNALLELFGASEYFLPIIKSLGVAILVQIASSVCSDIGESKIGEGIELAGKFEILLISLPLVRRIVEYALELMSFK